jgi:hypothetical protein
MRFRLVSPFCSFVRILKSTIPQTKHGHHLYNTTPVRALSKIFGQKDSWSTWSSLFRGYRRDLGGVTQASTLICPEGGLSIFQSKEIYNRTIKVESLHYPLRLWDIATLAAAREYPLFGQNTTISSNQAIRIYAAASAGNVSPVEGILSSLNVC